MTLSDLASIGSLVSGIAVLVSLIYLALQIRQTEKNQRALMNQGVVTRAAELLTWMAQPEISDLIIKVRSGEREYSAQELTKLGLVLRAMLLTGQDAYIQRKSGLTDQVTFDATIGGVKFWLALPASRALWKFDRTTYAPEWMSYVDRLIMETPLAKPADIAAVFKTNLAEVLAS
ncbi:MAG TPA: hypothetical protein VNU97_18240 [Rhizomicrobium sp.]|jgi:hypothetical protein|nr:hypothetical protein [Rhizomicrobium sp.]